MNKTYYQEVGAYYNHDSTEFESRYHENTILQKIRTEFRTITDAYDFNNALEVGYGPGLDLIYFAQNNPTKAVFGIDISEGMYEATSKNISASHLKNIQVEVGSVEDVSRLFPNQKFDLIYVFFGALNTVEDIDLAANNIHSLLTDDGVAVLTFVNKWYLRGMIVPLLKLKFKIAFARIQKIWGGYSTKYFLPSKCYSVREIKKAFKKFNIETIKGYSIFYPAWYDGIKYTNAKKLNQLWNLDNKIRDHIGKGFGEYTLYVMRKIK